MAAVQTSFAALLTLQAARGMAPAAPSQAAGPWAEPELWAVRELLHDQLGGLSDTFLEGGVFDRADATAWIFQVSPPLPAAVHEGIVASGNRGRLLSPFR